MISSSFVRWKLIHDHRNSESLSLFLLKRVFLCARSQIYYTGKYQSLGIKQGGPSAGKWVELPVTKSPKIAQFSVGHDGSHALLVAEDGSVFFTGSASKGEDGESSELKKR